MCVLSVQFDVCAIAGNGRVAFRLRGFGRKRMAAFPLDDCFRHWARTAAAGAALPPLLAGVRRWRNTGGNPDPYPSRDVARASLS